MKKYLFILGKIILNLLTLVISIAFFLSGVYIIFLIVIIIPIIIYGNYSFTKRWIPLCLYNLELLLSTAIGILLSANLYFGNIRYGTEGNLIMQYLIISVVMYVIILSGISVLFRIFTTKR